MRTVATGALLAALLASPSAAQAPAEFVYVANYFSENISGYRIDAVSGELQPVPGSPFPAVARAVSAAVDPSNRFLYVVSRDAVGVEGFSIGPSGALTPLPGSPFTLGPMGPWIMDPSSVVVDPTGRFLYITDTLFDQVRGFAIDAATGALSPVGTPAPIGANGDALSVDPSGRFLYATSFGFDTNLEGFRLDTSTGGLRAMSVVRPLGGRSGGTAVDPSGRYLFAASGAAGVAAYTLDQSTGIPSEWEDSPVPAGSSAADIALTPSGRFAYVTDSPSDQIRVFGLDVGTGALNAIAGAPAATGNVPGQLVVDPSNRFVYTVNRADDTVSGHAIAPDGTLTALDGFPVAAGDVPNGITTTNHDVILRDSFESGDLAAWSFASTGGGDLTVSESAGRHRLLGLTAHIDDTTPLFVRDDSPQDEDRYRARVLFEASDFDPGEGAGHRRARILLAFGGEPRKRLVALILRRRDGEHALAARVLRDDGTRADTGFLPISVGWHSVQLDWRRASAPGASDGSFELLIDDAPAATLTGLANAGAGVDAVQVGAMSLKSGASGALRFDAFESRRYNFIWPMF